MTVSPTGLGRWLVAQAGSARPPPTPSQDCHPPATGHRPSAPPWLCPRPCSDPPHRQRIPHARCQRPLLHSGISARKGAVGGRLAQA